MASITIHTRREPDAKFLASFDTYHGGDIAEFICFKLYVGSEEVSIFLTPKNVDDFKNTLRKAFVDSAHEKYLQEKEALTEPSGLASV